MFTNDLAYIKRNTTKNCLTRVEKDGVFACLTYDRKTKDVTTEIVFQDRKRYARLVTKDGAAGIASALKWADDVAAGAIDPGVPETEPSKQLVEFAKLTSAEIQDFNKVEEPAPAVEVTATEEPVAATEAPIPAAAPVTDTPKKERKTRTVENQFGLPPTALCRWMGANGFSNAQVAYALGELKIDISPATIHIHAGAGRTGKTDRGPVPELTQEHAKILLDLKIENPPSVAAAAQNQPRAKRSVTPGPKVKKPSLSELLGKWCQSSIEPEA